MNIEVILLSIIVIITFFYTKNIISYTIGWKKLKESKQKDNASPKYTFSIVIAFRNESENLDNLLHDLIRIRFPKHLFEVILVNDNSKDNSKDIVKDFIFKNNLNWQLLESDGGKKNAIKTAIQTAKNNFIFSTDADCRIPRNILNNYDQQLQTEKKKLIAGPVIFKDNNSLFSKLIDMEFMSLIVSGAGAISINRPIMINAANMVFEKSIATENVDNIYNSNIQSGDDIFLMQHIIDKYGEKEISFLKSKNGIIKTNSPKTIKAFVNQRLRWASKAKHYKINHTSKSAIGILLFNFIIIISLFLIASNYWYIFPVLYIIKLLVDIPILISASKFFDKSFSFPTFVLLESIYPLYIVGIGILSFFIKSTWKGRKI
jgi:cellulose synthase/poly-beta-1,6-N-acetylglucosamine synthase-like glycosyltransferase